MAPKVSIIILNYNGKKFNKDCLESLLAQSYQDFEIIFVDNASVDESVEEVEEIFGKEIEKEKIRIIRNPNNDGFAEGNNIGVRASRATDYIWLLNNDTVADKDALKYLIEGIESDKKIGAIGSLVLDKGYEEIIRNQIFKEHKKFTTSIFGETILENITGKEIRKGIYTTNVISGCAYLYRKSIVAEPFEAYYFAYAEDVFLSFKILILGYKLAISTKSTIQHFGSGSFGKEASDFKLFHGNKNQIINYLVFYTFWQKLILFPLFLIKELGHLFMGNPLKRIKAKIRAIVWIWKNRKLVKKTRTDIEFLNTDGGRYLLNNLAWKLTDIFYSHFGHSIKSSMVKIGNTIFSLYGKIIKYNIRFF